MRQHLEPVPLEEMHPLLQGLVQTLPPAGAMWTVAQQEHWLLTARSIFRLIYVGWEQTATIDAQVPRSPASLPDRESGAQDQAVPQSRYGGPTPTTDA